MFGIILITMPLNNTYLNKYKMLIQTFFMEGQFFKLLKRQVVFEIFTYTHYLYLIVNMLFNMEKWTAMGIYFSYFRKNMHPFRPGTNFQLTRYFTYVSLLEYFWLIYLRTHYWQHQKLREICIKFQHFLNRPKLQNTLYVKICYILYPLDLRSTIRLAYLLYTQE